MTPGIKALCAVLVCAGFAAAAPAACDANAQERTAALAAVRCFSNAGDTLKALTLLESLRQRFPKNEDVLYLSAKVHMKAFTDATYTMFERTPSSYRVHQLSAEIFETQNRFAEAIGEWRKAIEISLAAPDLHYRLGRALLLQSHEPAMLGAAKDAFAAELALNPDDSGSEYQLGQMAQLESHLEDAEKHFVRARELSPDFVAARVALGRLYIQEKHPDRAVPILKEAVALQQTNEGAHYALLTAYRNLGADAEARQEKAILDKLQKPPEGEFTQFLKRLGEPQPH